MFDAQFWANNPHLTPVHPVEFPGFESIAVVPDYLNDLNAMHEAWNKCIRNKDDLEDAFTHYLLVSVKRVGARSYPHSPDYSTADIAIISNANAAQRAEALLRTLNLWNDTK